MDPTAISTAGLASAGASPGLLTLFLQADIIVKLVIGVLLVPRCGAGP